MNLKHHKSQTVESWRKFPFYRQVLMVANEMNRAGNWIDKGDVAETRLCYERALELLYLTIHSAIGHGRLRELCRVKEVISSLFVAASPRSYNNKLALDALVLISPEGYNLLHPSTKKAIAGPEFSK